MYSSLSGIKKEFQQELSQLYSSREIDLVFYRIVEYVLGKSRKDLMMDENPTITEENHTLFKSCLDELMLNKPVQYIDNTAYFMDFVFYVDESVLIPRPETEELVNWILENHQEGELEVLDIGTGSGIISVSLANKRPSWNVMACDVSNEALVTARRNGRELLTISEVAFYKEDILNPKTDYPHQLDIIVSNPPYVLESDKPTMTKSVLEHEPHLALFVDDNNPLLFYEAIIKYAIQNLKTGGSLYFEVHENLANKVADSLKSASFTNLEVRKDMQGKERMVMGVRG